MQATASKFLSLKTIDLLKGLAMVVISSVVTTIYSAIDTGGLETINWKAVLTVAILSGLSYLIKNFFSPTEINIKNPSQSVVSAVENKEATVVVKPQ